MIRLSIKGECNPDKQNNRRKDAARTHLAYHCQRFGYNSDSSAMVVLKFAFRDWDDEGNPLNDGR